MAWMYLLIAGLFEIIGVIGVKKVAENNSWKNNIIFIGGFVMSFQFLRMALIDIPLSTGYAVWTGIGTLGAAIVGIFFFQEPKNAFRIFCIIGIVCTIIGLKVVS
ncbi:multidrug resistance protein SMR [Bacillus manliponensis]|uniref:Multidrug resistance protein SMR n=1 Tax=Bacillus manliponensis TaxID=574376 RepID=A0A073K5T4_9BACI|nr:multidrug efflux SMR transporter [Bacillus manliponensis]KEK17638.1 multidrug resistance protein SMR [Bacillus manliponensis]